MRTSSLLVLGVRRRGSRRDRVHHQDAGSRSRASAGTHASRLTTTDVDPDGHRRNSHRWWRRSRPWRTRRRECRRGQGAAANPLPYNRVVTAQAQTKNGFFKTIKVGERLLFEIPRSQMNKDILLVQEIAQTALGAGYDGQAAGNRVLRFERRDNRVLLRGVSNEIIASDTLAPVAGAVSASNVHPIIAIFNVEAYGPDSAAVIDVSRLFTQPPTELSPAARIAAGYTVDATRSWVERTSSFPDNVNVYSTLTLQQGQWRSRRRHRPADAAAGRGARGHHCSDGDDRGVVQLPQAARDADDAAPLRQARRLLLTHRHRLRGRRSAHGEQHALLHHALAPREEGPERGDLRAGEADRLLHRRRHAEEVGAVAQEGDRGLAAGVRGGGLQERDHRARTRRRTIPTGRRKTCATP